MGLIVADGGLGKSSLASSWAARRTVAWHDVTATDRRLETLAGAIVAALRGAVPALPAELAVTVAAARGPDAAAEAAERAQVIAALLCETLEARLARDLTLVLDDVHELGADSVSWRLVEELCRQAGPRLHVLLISRSEPEFALERMRGRGEVVEVTGRDLAFSVADVEALLAETLGEPDAELAAGLHTATAGWPAGVRLALEALRTVAAAERPAALEGLRRRQSPVFAYLAQEVFERAPGELRALVRSLAGLERASPELCAELGLGDVAATLESLARRGLFVEPDRGEPGWYRLSDIAREFVDEHEPLSDDERASLYRGAAAWALRQGRTADALRWLTALRDGDGLAAALAEHGERLLSAGEVETVLSATIAVPAAARDATVELVAGRARQIRGDWEGALACFVRAAGGSGELDAGIAWRMGLIHHFRGELAEADAVYGRGRVEGAAPRDAALLLASHAAVAWLRGDAETCRARVGRAYELAVETGDAQALATAHTVLAMLAALEGSGAAHTHYAQALAYAEQAGDVLQIIRISANRGSRFLDEGYYERSLTELERALALADVAGFAALRALALNNRGLARFALGRFEEACADLEEARGLYERIGSRNVSYPLCALGDVYRERGDHALSRAAYEEAIANARRAQDVQGIGHGTAGLARLLARDDPAAARQLADEALACGPGVMQVRALLAALTVALASEDAERARELAAEAVAVAGARRDRPGLATALELQAQAVGDAGLLEQACELWREIGNPLGEARSELALARLRGPVEGRELAERAEQRLRALGARGHAAAAADLLTRVRAGGAGADPDRVAGALPRAARRRARAGVGMAVAQGARPAEAARRAAGPARRARRADGGALARGRSGEAGQPPVGRAQHRPRGARSRAALRARDVRHRGRPERRPGAGQRGCGRRRVHVDRRGGAGAARRRSGGRGARPAGRRRGAVPGRLPRGGRVRGLGGAAARGSPLDLRAAGAGARRGRDRARRSRRRRALPAADAGEGRVRRGGAHRARVGAGERGPSRRRAARLSRLRRADARDRRRGGPLPAHPARSPQRTLRALERVPGSVTRHGELHRPSVGPRRHRRRGRPGAERPRRPCGERA